MARLIAGINNSVIGCFVFFLHSFPLCSSVGLLGEDTGIEKGRPHEEVFSGFKTTIAVFLAVCGLAGEGGSLRGPACICPHEPERFTVILEQLGGVARGAWLVGVTRGASLGGTQLV